MQHLIVPVDGSDASWRAVDVAVALAQRGDATVDVIEVVFDQHDVPDAEAGLSERLEHHDTASVQVTTHVRVAAESVAQVLGNEVEQHPEATVVLASHGRGRSAALLGSVTEELLERIFGPVLVVGPHVTNSGFDGPILVTVDGSDASESVLPLAAAWGIELGTEPWIVEVPNRAPAARPTSASRPIRPGSRGRWHADSGHPVQFEVLHGEHVHDEVADFASSLNASLIVASTRGRTGMSRFVIGSTAAAIVRHAPARCCWSARPTSHH
jgi:nucleotide-binding universal stress UspA family protein